MAAHGDEHEHTCSARRRRERRLRAWWRHEQFAIRCAVPSATHHSSRRPRRVDAEAQTTAPAPVDENIAPDPAVYPASAPVDEYVVSARVVEYMAPAPVTNLPQNTIENSVEIPGFRSVQGSQTSESVRPAPVRPVKSAETVAVIDFAPPLPAESGPPIRETTPVVEAPLVLMEDDPVGEYVARAPAVTNAERAPVVEHIALAPVVACAALDPVVEHMAPSPAVTHAVQAPVVEHMAAAPAGTYAVRAPEVEYIA